MQLRGSTLSLATDGTQNTFWTSARSPQRAPILDSFSLLNFVTEVLSALQPVLPLKSFLPGLRSAGCLFLVPCVLCYWQWSSISTSSLLRLSQSVEETMVVFGEYDHNYIWSDNNLIKCRSTPSGDGPVFKARCASIQISHCVWVMGHLGKECKGISNWKTLLCALTKSPVEIQVQQQP